MHGMALCYGTAADDGEGERGFSIQLAEVQILEIDLC
jgi:hypothetical protein